jgi:hypothetical protein
MHILYGGLRYENECFSFKYKSVWSDKFVFWSPTQSNYHREPPASWRRVRYRIPWNGDSGYVVTQGFLPAGGSHQASRSPTDRRRA